MDDDIAGIDQHPIAGLLALDYGHSLEHLFNVGAQSFGEGIYLPLRATAGNHHEIRNCRFAEQVDCRDIVRFSFRKGLFDKVAQRGRLV